MSATTVPPEARKSDINRAKRFLRGGASVEDVAEETGLAIIVVSGLLWEMDQ